jgi:hypothetical protein
LSERHELWREPSAWEFPEQGLDKRFVSAFDRKFDTPVHPEGRHIPSKRQSTENIEEECVCDSDVLNLLSPRLKNLLMLAGPLQILESNL